MTALQDVKHISFVVDVLAVRNGRKLGAIRPDEDGYYTVPLAVLGTPTDNRTYYEVEDFVSQLTSKESFINKCLSDGKLFGEYGHPMIRSLAEDQQLPRLMVIDEKNVSHQIGKIWTGEILDNGGRILYGHIKPTGPYGEDLQSSLDDPCINTSFSLRSIAHSRDVNGLIRRRIKHLVTFDFVNAGGYAEASKRYSPGVESLLEIDLMGGRPCVTESAMEHLSETEINEIFGAKIVTIGQRRVTFRTDKDAFQDATGRLRSVYMDLVGLRPREG